MWLSQPYSATRSVVRLQFVIEKTITRARSLNCFWNKVHLVRLTWYGFERRVSQGHGSAVAIACDIHASVKLLRQRLDKTGPEPALVFARFYVRLADAVIGNRQLPVAFRDPVRNHDCRILPRSGERML